MSTYIILRAIIAVLGKWDCLHELQMLFTDSVTGWLLRNTGCTVYVKRWEKAYSPVQYDEKPVHVTIVVDDINGKGLEEILSLCLTATWCPFAIVKGTWQWGGFSGVFVEIGSSWVPYTTVPFGPFRFWLRIRGDIRIRKTTPRYHRYGESATPRITDTESRLFNFFKRKLSVSMIRRVVDSPHQSYGDSPTPRIGESGSRY